MSRWLRDQRVPIAFVLAAVAWIALLLVTGREISVWTDFRRDVMVRDGYSLDEINDVRFYDSSPYSIWLPSDMFVRDSIRRLELPLWNRGQAGGYSPLLNLQNGVLHPIRWVAAVFPRPFASSAIIIVSLLVLCVGTFVMLRRVFGLSESSSALGAVLLILSGYIMSIAHFSGALIPLIQVPWLVFTFSIWVESRRTSAAAAFAVFVFLLILSGHPLIIAVAGLVSAVLAVWRTVAAGKTRQLIPGAGLVLSGSLLTAVVTLPMILNIPYLWSYKNATPEGVAFEGVAGIGGPDALLSVFVYEPFASDLIDGGSIAFYLGVVPAALMIIGLFVALKRRMTVILPLLVVLGWMLSVPPEWLVEFGGRTPLRYFKPWYLMFVMVFPAAIAVALGFDSLLKRVRLRPGLEAAVIAAAFAAVVIPGLAPAVEVLRPRPMSAPVSPAIDFLRSREGPFRIVGLSGQTHLPNAASITGIEDVRFSSPVHPIRYHEWIRLAAPEWGDDFPTSTLIHDADSPMFRAFNVGYVVRSMVFGHDVQSFVPRPGLSPPEDYLIDPPPDPRSFERIFDGPSVEIYEAVRSLHPRAHFADEFVAVNGGLASVVRSLRGLSSGSVELVEVPAHDPDVLQGVVPSATGDEVHVTYPSGRRVTVETRADGARLLVLHDSWDRGWSAMIDGVEAELLPVSLLSRGVVVPAGDHEVEMTFTPVGAGIGLLVTLLGACLCPILSRWTRRSMEQT